MRILFALAFFIWPFCAPTPKSATITFTINGQTRTATIQPLTPGSTYTFNCDKNPCVVVRVK